MQRLLFEKGVFDPDELALAVEDFADFHKKPDLAIYLVNRRDAAKRLDQRKKLKTHEGQPQ